MSEEKGLVMINLVPVKKGVAPEEFARFSAEVDLPTWRAQEVVRSFETYQVVRRVGDIGVDFVEVMELASMEEWERVSTTSEVGKSMAATFDSLADGPAVRTLFAYRIRTS
jgi:hypothetical protein